MGKDVEEFELFKEEFKRYQREFGLMGYKIFFEYLPFNDDFAGIKIELPDRTVTVRLNSKLPKWEQEHKDVKRLAKHEAIHLLLGRLYELAKERYVSVAELYEADEEIAYKLTDLLPDM